MSEGRELHDELFTNFDDSVTTPDGYILNVHRCVGGPVSPPRAGKQVVFLMHGMLSSSADYVIMGPHVSLVYMLSDLGYDGELLIEFQL